jgi:Protein of unknown function, DUF488
LARAQQSPGDLRSGSGGALPILTIGHSTRPIDEFIELLRRNGVERLVDIRTIPRSRRNPQFNSEALAKSLEDKGIGYVHLKELGGLRHPRHDSLNTGWRNAGFRGYADYLQTAEFEEALRRLLELCEGKRCAAMCAEAVPWRCHRSLLADALVARGIPVEHILSGSRRDVHSLTPFARIENGRVIYPEAKAEAGRKKATGAQTELRFGDSEAAMPSKKRKMKFSAAKEARRRARLAAGTPPTERVIPDKRRKPPRHKKPIQELGETPE